MNSHDINALLSVAGRCAHKRFDILPVVQFLLQFGSISFILYEELIRLFTTGEACLKIILRLPKECTFQQLIYALFMCNHGELAEELKMERFHRGHMCIYSLARSEGFHTLVAKFYRHLKMNIDNCVFVNKRDYLWKTAQSLKARIVELPRDSSRQRQAADKLMVTQCLRLEIYQDTIERFSIIQDMREGMHLASVTAEGDAIFKSKLGSTFALDGDFITADKYIRGARSGLLTTAPSFGSHYINLNEVFTKLVEYKTNSSDSIKSSLPFIGNRGLQSTTEDIDEIHTTQIKLMVLTFMISCLLGVGINFDEINVEVTEKDKKYAKSLLVQFDNLSDNLESRREMVYCYLMSRLWMTDDRERALHYAKRARVLSKDGAFRNAETDNISNLIVRLEARR